MEGESDGQEWVSYRMGTWNVETYQSKYAGGFSWFQKMKSLWAPCLRIFKDLGVFFWITILKEQGHFNSLIKSEMLQT